METIRVRIVTINGEEAGRTYIVNGSEYKYLSDALRAKYGNHGNFYMKECGVSWEDAYMAGWHPEHSEFCFDCDGWRKFIDSRGKIQKTVEERDVDIMEEIFEEDDGDEEEDT